MLALPVLERADRSKLFCHSSQTILPKRFVLVVAWSLAPLRQVHIRQAQALDHSASGEPMLTTLTYRNDGRLSDDQSLELGLITERRDGMVVKEFAPVTPGEMLKEEFVAGYGLSQNQLAKAIGISPTRIAKIVNNRRRITADTALRLSLYFGNSPEFWMNLQTHYDLKRVRKNLEPMTRNASKRGERPNDCTARTS
jgi:addiction module HigA family antidote